MACEAGQFRLTHVLHGAMRVEWLGEARTLLPGSLLLVPPRRAVRIRRGPDAEVMTICFSGSQVDPFALGPEARAAVEMLGSIEPITARLSPEDHRDTRDQDILLALKTTGPEALDWIWKCVGDRSEPLRATLRKMGPVRLVDADAAERRIVAVIRRMEEEGAIVISRAGADLVE